MKTIIIIGLLILVGCETVKPNGIKEGNLTHVVLNNGDVVCMVEYTKASFENVSGYVQEINNHKTFAINIESHTEDDGRYIFKPGSDLIFCNNMSDMSGDCVDKKAEVQLPCSWCVHIKNDYSIKDDTEECLSNQEMTIQARYWEMWN